MNTLMLASYVLKTQVQSVNADASGRITAPNAWHRLLPALRFGTLGLIAIGYALLERAA